MFIEIISLIFAEMDVQDDNTYLSDVGNFLRETQTRGSETCSIPTFQEVCTHAYPYTCSKLLYLFHAIS